MQGTPYIKRFSGIYNSILYLSVSFFQVNDIEDPGYLKLFQDLQSKALFNRYYVQSIAGSVRSALLEMGLKTHSRLKQNLIHQHYIQIQLESTKSKING